MEEDDFQECESEAPWVGSSVPDYDPRYAQTREVVCHHTPAREAILKEGATFEKTIVRLHAEISRARSRGDDARAEALERQLDRAVEAWGEWSARDGAGTEEEGAGLAGYLSIGDLISRDIDSGAELDEREREIRMETLRALMLFVCQDGVRSLVLAFKNFLSVVRMVAPEVLAPGGMTQADLAEIFGETRAATCAREKKLEAWLEAHGVRGWLLLGGGKGMETRRRNREAARGNRSRKKGRDRKW